MRASCPKTTRELGEILETHTVFGRVTPEQKKRMVVALQARGHTVAMTGDGVNDALAIKTADIGIAMNSGAAATKAVARLVLLDGQFSHLPDVVAEGRQVIANIERVSMLFLNKTVYATGLAILFGVLVLEFPFLPRQLSITDGLTIGIPAFFLALMHNSQRYVPGFLKRSLSFAIPVRHHHRRRADALHARREVARRRRGASCAPGRRSSSRSSASGCSRCCRARSTATRRS